MPPPTPPSTKPRASRSWRRPLTRLLRRGWRKSWDATGAAGALLNRLRLRRQQAARRTVQRGRSDGAPQRLRTDQAGRRASDHRERMSLCHPAHHLGVRHARQELSAHGRFGWRASATSCAWSATSTAHRPGREALPRQPLRSSLGVSSTEASKQWRAGLFHLTAAGQTSWAGFAEAIIQEYEGAAAGRPTRANSARH